MERDFIGYGRTPPVVPWPNGARLAVQVSVAYEEGGEYSLLDGPRRETMGEVPSPVPPDRRDRRTSAFTRVRRTPNAPVSVHASVAGRTRNRRSQSRRRKSRRCAGGSSKARTIRASSRSRHVPA